MVQNLHLRRAVILGALGAVGVAFLACTVGTTTSGAGGSAQPQEQAEITSPASGLKVTASISAVTLGDECGSSESGLAPSGDCAPPPLEPDAGGGSTKAPGCGGSFCQQSNMQLAFNAGTGTQDAHVEIVTVTLHEAATGKLVDTLTSSKPQAWNGNGYSAWNQAIKPGGELKASYDLSAPRWSTISSSSAPSSFATKYRLHVTLRVDGVEVVLESTDLNREPQVAT